VRRQPFWIVDSDARTMECFRLQAGACVFDASAGEREALSVPSFEGLSLPLESLWLDG